MSPATAARAHLEQARRAHMLAVQAAIAAGVPGAEVDEDAFAFARAARQMVTICTMPTGRGPMVLVPGNSC